jgi:hypothetical protein
VAALRTEGEKFLIEYDYSGGTTETVKLEGVVVTTRGLFSSKTEPIEITLRHASKSHSCIVQPIYSWWHIVEEKLHGIRISVDGETIIDKVWTR